MATRTRRVRTTSATPTTMAPASSGSGLRDRSVLTRRSSSDGVPARVGLAADLGGPGSTRGRTLGQPQAAGVVDVEPAVAVPVEGQLGRAVVVQHEAFVAEQALEGGPGRGVDPQR